MTRLLVEQSLAKRNTVEIRDEELHYLTHVKRHGIGDRVEVLDGAGDAFESKIENITANAATLSIQNALGAAAKSHPVTLIMAVPKRALMDETVRMASELGVERIISAITERSVVKPGENKTTRWRKIAWESRRQCRRKTPLDISDVIPFSAALESASQLGTRCLLDPETQAAASTLAGMRFTPPVTVAIGPEGGFTIDERGLAESMGYEVTRLGSTILKIETAAIAAAVLCVAKLGGFD